MSKAKALGDGHGHFAAGCFFLVNKLLDHPKTMYRKADE